MRQYLLDTNVLGAYLQGRPGAISLAQAWIHNDEAATSIVVYGDIDTLIAATAVNYRLTLVTTDSDFTRVPDLSLIHIPLSSLRG